MPVINDAYYRDVASQLQTCPLAEFSAVVETHKANILATKFNEPSSKVFAENLSWIAQQVIMQPGSRNFKEPAQITDGDIEKLELLRQEQGFDYMKELRLGFTATRENKKLEYTEPFLVYLASKTGDFTDRQREVVEQVVARLEGDNRKWDLGVSYAMRSGRGNNHNDSKNIFHVLLAGALSPNKKAIADLVAPELAEKSYRIYATTASWEGSRGQTIYQPWDTYRNALHDAVASGRIENVEYALEKGVQQSTLYNSYGSTAFADAAAKADDPAYRAIAMRLFENALTLEKGVEILRAPARWEKTGRRPIETLARLGDLPFTLAMAQANAGAPELAAHAFNYAAKVTAGGYHSVSGQDTVYHAPIELTQTRTEWQVVETGNTESPFPYIRQAVFNLDPKTGVYDTHQDIFGRALKHLVEKRALVEADIPADSLSDPRSLNFIFSLRAVAEAEKARNPDFLAKTAVFTDSFTKEVEQARGFTNNFRILYDAKHPEETRAKSYGVENFSTGKPLAAKGPVKFKKTAGGKTP